MMTNDSIRTYIIEMLNDMDTRKLRLVYFFALHLFKGEPVPKD